MGNMGSAVVESVVQNYGKSEVLTRMSDPNWFQALGAVMGMQWNSSGVTATDSTTALPKLPILSVNHLGTLPKCSGRPIVPELIIIVPHM
jgi:hypothetical protein